MPKCMVCGKKFDSLAALREHHRAVHRKEKFVAPTVSASRNLMVGLIIVIVAVGGVVGYLIYEQQISSGHSLGGLGTPISTSLYQNLTGVSYSTLAAVGNGQDTAPSSISSSLLAFNGKPEILYIGAEYCPYCAAERWSLVVALSKFGAFANLEYMQSAPNDGNIATLTFRSANYTSQYVAFVTVENEDRNHNTLQLLTSEEQTLWNDFGSSSSGNTYPFIDIGGNYTVTTSQFPPTDLSGLNWTQIASQLNNPSSSIAKAIDGSANTLISAICKIDNNQGPNNICAQSFAKLLSFNQTTSDPSRNALAFLVNSEVNRQRENIVPRLAKSLL